MPSDAERILAYIEEKRSARVSCCEDEDEPRSNPAELDALAEAVKALERLSHDVTAETYHCNAPMRVLASIAKILGVNDE